MAQVFCSKCGEGKMFSDICDFCMHYNFNGKWYHNGSDGSHGPVYVDEGYCYLDGFYRDPYDTCDRDDFHCFLAKKGM